MAGSTDPFTGLAADLSESPFARIRYVEETGSTNEDAARLLGDAEHAGLSIVAGHQTRGSGRKGRTWLDRAGDALLVSTILPRAIATGALWAVPFWAALAARNALGALEVHADLHWPNDLLLGGRKLAGILCVSRVAGERAWVACGIGINLTRSDDAPAVEPPPAFCDDVAPAEAAVALRELLRAYDASLDEIDDPKGIARAWERAAGLPGRRYRIHKDGAAEPFEATALALATGGGLVVARENGARETVAMADARALRP